MNEMVEMQQNERKTMPEFKCKDYKNNEINRNDRIGK